MKYSIFAWRPFDAPLKSSVPFLNTPWQRWPNAAHLSLAFALIAIVCAIAWSAINTIYSRIRTSQDELQTAQKQLLAIRQSARELSQTNFTHGLPQATRSDDVIRDMTRSAQSLGIQISSLTVQTQPRSERELGKIQYQLSMTADYRSTKTWLAELLGRYPTLGIQNMTMRAQPNEPTRQETRATLVFFVKS